MKIPKHNNLKIGATIIGASMMGGAYATYTFINKGGVMLLYVIIACCLASLFGWAMVISGISKRFEWPHEFRDDIAALTEGRVTRVWLALGLAIIATMYFGVEFVYFKKWEADWFGLPVIWIAIFAAIFTAGIVNYTEWFQDRSWRLSHWMVFPPLVALVLSTWLGGFYTEPVELGAQSRTEMASQKRQQQNYNDYETSRAGVYYHSYWFSSTTSSSGGSVSVPSCSGKSCEGYAILFVIVVIILILIGSATIPSFWVVGGAILLVLIWMMWYRELLANEDAPQYRHRAW